MSLLKWAFIVLLVLPVAEFAVFLLAATMVGWLWTALALVGTSLLGIVLLKRSGSHELARLAGALRSDRWGALRLDSPGAGTLLGAILLVLPGFITGILGGALFIPQFRRWATSTLAKRAGRLSRTSRHRGQDHILDLKRTEWHQIQDPKQPGGGERPRHKPRDGSKSSF
ncbi:MAG: FxsA family protein [Alphaproteobacteria bacterium]|jgi:UPF0716 protein FxsA|nr:MAG: FxsA family protein [Alphaproteobacteria bacterium]